MALLLTAQADARCICGGAASSGSGAVSVATGAALDSAQQAAAAAKQSQAALLRAKQALQSVQTAAQAAARAGNSSFNGLGAGALHPVVNPNSSTDGLTAWTGASLPTQSVSNGKYDVNIRQTQSRAILSWDSFNVGSATKLTFDQQGNNDWVALNRVVGNSIAPSQILGSIKADGAVLVINQNGVIFGAGSQVNVHSLIASTQEIGRSADGGVARTIAQRNDEFLNYGLTGYAETYTGGSTFAGVTSAATAPGDAAVKVEQGATITSDSGGMILLIAPSVTNAGRLSAADGQVSLAGVKALTGGLTLTASDGSSTSTDPYVRGYLIDSGYGAVVNSGLIEAERGYVSLGNSYATVTNSGILRSTTSVSANGAIDIVGRTITLSPGSIVMAAADDKGETIPQDATSLAAFKSSQVRIGSYASDVTLQSGATIWAPSGDVTIGAKSGQTLVAASQSSYWDTDTRQDVYIAGHIVVENGATIDVAGLKDVSVPTSSYNLSILLKGNELADSGGYQNSFLNGATVMIDARLSGVRSDGVAWIGSPLISAAAYYEAVGVTAAQLMTKGGNVALGTNGGVYSGTTNGSASVTVKPGALIDVSGGWVTYEAGLVTTTKLLTSTGLIVDIGGADLSNTYVAIASSGFTRNHAHWGVTETWANLLRGDGRYEAAYAEGRDAGSLTVKSAQASIDGVLNGEVYPGVRQIAKGEAGSGKTSVYGDLRNVQKANSQLPAGGMLFVQEIGVSPGSGMGAGGDIRVVAASDSAPVDGVTVLSDALLSGSGLSQVSLWTSGAISVASNATVSLAAGGVFDAYAGRSIKIAGTVTAPSGKILLETANFGSTGSAFSSADDKPAIGSFDITVTGTLSVAGRWVNDYGKTGLDLDGPAYLDGGGVTMVSAATVTDQSLYDITGAVTASTDVSGSILLAGAKLIDLSSGGRVKLDGALDLSGKGGSLALINQSGFSQLENVTYSSTESYARFGELTGFRARYEYVTGYWAPDAINPTAITSTVQFDPSSIKAAGFAGGGAFTLWAPDVKFGSGSADDTALATAIPLDFFQKGFASYDITSYKTLLVGNAFVNASGVSLGGANALLQTQTYTVKAGETLLLSQALLPSVLTSQQAIALRNLATGDDVTTVLTASTPTETWDQKAVNLTLDGMIELKVEAGGSIVSAPGAVLTVAKLLNEGSIRLPGGNIVQSQTLPSAFAGYETITATHALSDVFTVESDGSIVETKASKVSGSTNATLAMTSMVYLLGDLEASDGIVLAEGGVTDLSGVSVINPYAAASSGISGVRAGAIHDAGSIVLASASTSDSGFYRGSYLDVIKIKTGSYRPGLKLTIATDATVALDGASDTYSQLFSSSSGASGAALARRGAVALTATQAWSDAGAISAPNGFTISSGAILSARGGSASAEGGALELGDVVLTQSVADAANLLSADQIMASGFTSLAALGSLSSQGDVTLALGKALFVASRPYDSGSTLTTANTNTATANAVVIKAGGDLAVTAPYIGLLSSIDVLTRITTGLSGLNTVTLHATEAFDITGAVLFDRSVATTKLISDGDLRLTGVPDYKISYLGYTSNVSNNLTALLAVNGDLAIAAAQVYPTTGATATISTAKTGGAISFARSTTALPDAPYSAGGSLTVSAGDIVQGGVIRTPLGSLRLAATGDLTLTDGSYTEVSANGLIIPYGATTDGVEWYFTPTGSAALSAPPAKLLTLSGANIKVTSGAVINISGGGDITAYEFAAGTGGSRDVLNSYNDDAYTSKTGSTYTGGAQAYAIVPGLSDKAVAAYDPVYSANYAKLSSVTGVGSRVLIDIGEGLKWYTLLPAQYATLAGGALVVEQTGSTKLALGSSTTRADGSVLTVGSYGNALSGAAQSSTALFAVQSQSVFEKYSSIKLTSGNSYFAKLAAKNDTVTPALAIDAGKLVLNAGSTLLIDAVARSAAAAGGRGAKVDIGGGVISIVSSPPASPADGALTITASSLTNLGAESLLVGAIRTDNSDGSTNLAVSAGSITIANDAAHPIEAAEILFAAKGSIMIADGSAIVATGEMADTRNGVYAMGDSATSGAGALLRVANGPERLTSRANFANTATLTVGAATLSGAAVMFDSSGNVALSSGLALNKARYVALGAGRIGLGITDPGYAGTVLTPEMQAVLSQTGGQLTLRSQSSIDFADGTYSFGALKLDASILAGTQGGAVTIAADAVTLGNSGAAGYVCGECAANSGALAIKADEILFSGGLVATKATTIAATRSATLAADTVVTVPAGTVFASGQSFLQDTKIILQAGASVSLAVGTGVITPTATSGATIASGAEITIAGMTYALAAGAYKVAEATSYYVASNEQTVSLPAGGVVTVTTTPTFTIPTGAAVDLSGAATIATTNYFAGGVTLAATKGVYATGGNAGFNAGSAALTLHTPYIGDRASRAGAVVVPDLTLATTGALRIDDAGAAKLDIAKLGGVSGAALTFNGGSVAISGATLHASGGLVQVTSAGAITLSDGAVVEAPGYTGTYGDATDSTSVSSAGGAVRLTAKAGDITLGAGTRVSVAGDAGDAGRLEISAVAGNVSFGGGIDGTAGTSGAGGVFALETGGGVDLVALNTLVGSYGFTGGFEVHSHSGDLVLAAGQRLKSGSVALTADGGFVIVSGAIDTSGVNGGEIALWGDKGVTLTSTAKLDAHANGYADTDTRQASAGDVTLGTDFIAGATSTSADGVISGASGAISIAAGATLDLSARRPGNRVIALESGLGYYYVDGDTGGALTLRAPVITDASGHQTVDVTVADAASVVGAKSVVLEGFRRWDLKAVAASGRFAGVTYNAATNTVTLDASIDLDAANTNGTRTATGGINFLGDEDAGTLSNFVQTLDLSASYARLGGLAGLSTFHATAGLDLVHDGDITLASNWNFGAGVVNVDAAVAAGAMTGSGSSASVVSGKEGEVLGRFTRMLYRTGGSALGEAPILTLRAGGNLRLDGSITDGFFQFADPNAPASVGLGGAVSDFRPYGGSLNLDYSLFNLLFNLKVVSVSGTGAPYNNAGNSVAALTDGDTLLNSVIFPQACSDAACASSRSVSSSSYRLVAGAAVKRDAGELTVAVDPLTIDRGSGGTFSISPSVSRSVTASIDYSISFPTIANQWGNYNSGWSDAAGLVAVFGGNATANFDVSGYTVGSDSLANVFAAFQSDLSSGTNPELNALVAQYGLPSSISTSIGNSMMSGPAALVGYLVTHYNFASALATAIRLSALDYGFSSPLPTSGSYTLTTKNMIRTGAGDIAIAAAGNVDLTGGVAANSAAATALIYTAGQRATTATTAARDVSTGGAVTVGLTSLQTSGKLYLTNGGDVSITAGQDVLGRSGSLLADTIIDGTGKINITGANDSLEPTWLNGGSSSSATSVGADQYIVLSGLTTGVGALAGGDITIKAGRDVDDAPVLATSAIRTVAITKADGSTAKGVQFLGDSNVAIAAGRDIAGGLVYLTSGSVTLDAVRDITASGGSLLIGTASISNMAGLDRSTRLRLINAAATATAGRNVSLTWAGALPFSSGYGEWVTSASSLKAAAGGDLAFNLWRTDDLNTLDGAVTPGDISLAALSGDLTFGNSVSSARAFLFMEPDPTGNLALVAGGDIGAATISMEDSDPVNLPGPFFTIYRYAWTSYSGSALRSLIFPTVTSQTSEAWLRLYHNEDITHLGDANPVFIAAGDDITNFTLSAPKAARVTAGGDIVNMMFFGQNLASTDVTRIAAGGDITATSTLLKNIASGQDAVTRATLQGNTFVIGGPGSFILEAGGDIGPFLNSATVTIQSGNRNDGYVYTTYNYAGGVRSVGYDWNPWLKTQVKEAGGGADLYVMFGQGAIGPDYAGFRESYVNPANAASLTWGGYGETLLTWMKARYASLLIATYGTTEVSETQAYAAFVGLPAVEQHVFLLSKVYFNELEQVAVTTSASYEKYSRGYEAVNTLFPAANGFTANSLEGGAVDTARVHTGDLDLRLATLQTTRGGDIRLLGPGGDVIAGSVVRTATQAARRNYDTSLYGGGYAYYGTISDIDSIPTGFEGILTLRGGSVSSFTDGSLVLNQSRLFTQNGGDIVAWSSNGDLNAGQGPKTSANFPPIAVDFDWNLFAEVDELAGVSGAGIAAFQPEVGIKAPDVYLLAPRGTVDAGDAGVRVAGNLSVVAYQVRNADNFQVGGAVVGLQMPAAAPVALTTTTQDNAANSAVKEVAQPAQTDRPSVIIVEVIGYGGGGGDTPPANGDEERRRTRAQHSYNANGAVQVLGHGVLTDQEKQLLSEEEKARL